MNKKRKDTFKRYIKLLAHQSRSPEDALYICKIISIVLNAMNNKPALFDPTTSPEPSEQDLVVKFLGPYWKSASTYLLLEGYYTFSGQN